MTNTAELLLTQESRRPDRFFIARHNGQETLFVLHTDHTLCIARTTQPVAIEAAETVMAELRGLAA
jgi:hypothetical protein